MGRVWSRMVIEDYRGTGFDLVRETHWVGQPGVRAVDHTHNVVALRAGVPVALLVQQVSGGEGRACWRATKDGRAITDCPEHTCI